MRTVHWPGAVAHGLEKGTAMTTSRNYPATARRLVAYVSQGFLELLHNSLALIGLAVACVVMALIFKPELRHTGESQLRDWLHTRHVAVTGFEPEPDAVDRATAVNPKELPEQQAAVAFWLSKKYRVAAEPMAALVAEAYIQGKQHKLDPMLLLAVMAIESSFNPFAQSSVGAQGLMQVMTRVHTEKYEHFGGSLAAFDPISNVRVGASILKEYVRRAGSVEGGLKYYVGAANLPHDGGYGAKVLAEYHRIRAVAGTPVPSTPMLMAQKPAAPAQPAAEAATPAVASESVAAAAIPAGDLHSDLPTQVASSNL